MGDNGLWGAVKNFDPSVAERIQSAFADRSAGLSGFGGKLVAARQLPGWQGPGKEAASGSFVEPLGYLAEARSATEQADAKVGDFAEAMGRLRARAVEVEAMAQSAGFSVGADGSIRDSYALAGLVGSLSPADRARYEQVRVELPAEVSAVLAQAKEAESRAVAGLRAAGNLAAVRQLGAAASQLAAEGSGDDLVLYVEGPHQPDGVNHDSNWQQVLKLIDGAQKSVDVTMYGFTDPAIRDALVDAAARGVKVRVVLDKGGQQKKDQPVFDYLNSHGVQAVWSSTDDFRFTHQKTVTVDGETSAVMTGNFDPEYYDTARDFVVLDTNKRDVAAIQDVFNHDFVGTGGTKTDGYTPPTGDNLVWSPTNAQGKIFALIDGAKHTLSLDQQYVASQDITDHLVAAAQRGVDVQVTMVNNPSYYKYWDQLAAAGVDVHLYGRNADMYIHAKNIVADNTSALVGSINLSDNSMLNNRELAVATDDLDVVAGLETTNASDFVGGYEYRPAASDSKR
ncbi:phospholipase D-like domain-containing protein [Segniliparus rugosus]|nr:phospholipase D-like domain-containing protein [Segniliparus rugosus]